MTEQIITEFVKVTLKDPAKGSIKQTIQTPFSLVLDYPCPDSKYCTPYVINLSQGVYKFECWGSKGAIWSNPDGFQSTPGLGGYTAGTIYISRPTTFYVLIGNTGPFNVIRESISTTYFYSSSGGPTDVRLNFSENWWDASSLISRIMVSAGGGGSEWSSSIGGHGGGLTGGESTSAQTPTGSSVFSKCPGATQTHGSDCSTLTLDKHYLAVRGEFGYCGFVYNGQTNRDYGGFGGGGYYAGTSYQYAFGGSGGSSFISGHEGCDAVKNQTNPIEHTGQPIHYSGYVFTNTEMISGNQIMPLPTSSDYGIYSGEGAFRITVDMYQYQCPYKRKPLVSSLSHHHQIIE